MRLPWSKPAPMQGPLPPIEVLRLKYHLNGKHKEPAGGATPTHFYCCAFCRPDTSIHEDRETELIIVPKNLDPAHWLDYYRGLPR